MERMTRWTNTSVTRWTNTIGGGERNHWVTKRVKHDPAQFKLFGHWEIIGHGSKMKTNQSTNEKSSFQYMYVMGASNSFASEMKSTLSKEAFPNEKDFSYYNVWGCGGFVFHLKYHFDKKHFGRLTDARQA